MLLTSWYLERTARQWIYATVVLFILLSLTEQGLLFLRLPDFSFRPYMQFASVLLLLYFSYPVYADAKREIAGWAFGSSTVYAVTCIIALGVSIVQLIRFEPDISPHMSLGIVAWLSLTGYLVGVACYSGYNSKSVRTEKSQAILVDDGSGKAHITRMIALSMFVVAIGTSVVWYVVFLMPLHMSILAGLTVLVSVLPSLYQIVMSSYTKTAMGIVQKFGWNVSSIQAFVSLHAVRTVIIDDIASFVTNKLHVQKIVLLPQHANPEFLEKGERTLVQYADALESESSHPAASALAEYMRDHSISRMNASSISQHVERGVQGLIGSIAYAFGSKEFLQEQGVWGEDAEVLYRNAMSEQLSPVFLADVRVIGAVLYSRSDINRAKEALNWLRKESIYVFATVKKSDQHQETVTSLFHEDELIVYESEQELASLVNDISSDDTLLLAVGSTDTQQTLYSRSAISMILAGTFSSHKNVDITIPSRDVTVVKDSIALAQAVYRYALIISVIILGYTVVIIPVASGAFITSGWYMSFTNAAVVQVCFSSSVWILLHVVQRSLYTKALRRYGTR